MAVSDSVVVPSVEEPVSPFAGLPFDPVRSVVWIGAVTFCFASWGLILYLIAR
jgi:hypothetical protein